MSFVVGKKVAPPDGTSVLFEVSGALGRSVPVEVEGGRAHVRPEPGSEPTVTLTMDQDAFWRLGFGRVSAAEALASGEARLSGDVALGQRVLESMNFMI
jgi:putative sterol carrier protein